MTESEYHQLADAALARIEAALDESDADVDYDRPSGGMLELRFGDKSVIVVNKQAPLCEIWVAARAGGFHYAYRDGQWIANRDGGELFADLSRFASAQAGAPVVIRYE
jgi:CyaY protein